MEYHRQLLHEVFRKDNPRFYLRAIDCRLWTRSNSMYDPGMFGEGRGSEAPYLHLIHARKFEQDEHHRIHINGNNANFRLRAQNQVPNCRFIKRNSFLEAPVRTRFCIRRFIPWVVYRN